MVGTRRTRVRALALVVAISAALWVPAAASAADEVAFTIQDRRVAESSGLATDFGNELYWTVNDSGDSGVGYAMDRDGGTEGTVRFLAQAGRHRGGGHQRRLPLLRRHRGQPQAPRLHHRLLDRESRTRRRDPHATARTTSPIPTAPTTPRRCSSVRNGRFFFVTKEAKGGIYRAPAEPSRFGVNELRRVGDAPRVRHRRRLHAGRGEDRAPHVRVDRDAGRVLVRGDRAGRGSAAAAGRVDHRRPEREGPAGGQRRGPLDRLPDAGAHRDGLGSQAHQHPADGDPEPDADADHHRAAGGKEEEPTAPPENAGGTWLAVGIAAAVAVVAGAAAVLLRRR